MSDRAAQTTLIFAPLQKCWDVALDFERYPEWARDVKEAVVRRRDDQGRASLVEFRASALGRSTRYTLSYDYAEAPNRLSWHLVNGDIMRSIDGAYSFVEVDGGTQVFYEIEIELVIPLPGFVKRRAEQRILDTVKELKTRAES
ncbi:MAG: SRPBCC family protein [Acidimicrobiales bacterium]